MCANHPCSLSGMCLSCARTLCAELLHCHHPRLAGTPHRILRAQLILESWDYQVQVLGLTPIVELSFMPAVLAGCKWNRTGYPVVNPTLPACSTMMVYKGVQQPPTDFNDWCERAVSFCNPLNLHQTENR